jgi:hypothetical protein
MEAGKDGKQAQHGFNNTSQSARHTPNMLCTLSLKKLRTQGKTCRSRNGPLRVYSCK